MLVPMLGLLAAVSPLIPSTHAIQLDITSASSVTSAAEALAANLMSYYTGSNPGDNPGNLPAPYYWWEAGGMFGHMIDYWYYTGDDQYNWKIRQAVTWQAGSNGAFMPSNQTTDEGNDDQVFWGFTAAEAAETNFEAPLANESSLSYIGMAQSVAYTMNNRWDTTACGGGLRWQTQPFKGSGYLYKNSVANGGFFLLLSRIARYTGNNSYVDLADRSWDWFSNSVLYDNSTGAIYDGTSMDQNCTIPNKQQWSYNYTLWMAGLAFLYNYTQNSKYLAPLKTIITHFFQVFAAKNNVIQEPCEASGNCDQDQFSFKSYDMRWLVLTMQLVPETQDLINTAYKASAEGAAGQCDGPNNACGYNWLTTTYSPPTGVGQQMSALAAIQGLLFYDKNLKLPYTVATGGSSKPNANVGQGDTPQNNTIATRPITTGDRAGAGILTALALAFTVAGTYWLVT